MFHQYLCRRVWIPELERGEKTRDGSFPSQLLFIDQFREHQCCERLGIGCDHEQRVRVRFRIAVEIANPETIGEYDFAALDQASVAPGIRSSLKAVSTNLESSAIRGASRVCAFFPTNDSRV